MLQYEVVSQEAFGSFMKSDHREALKADYGRNFGSTSKRDGISYVQVRP